MASLADLLVKLDVDSGSFRKELDRAGREVSRFSKAATTASKLVAAAFAWDFLKSTTKSMYDFVTSGTSAADMMGKAAQSAGIGVEAMSKLAYAAELNNVEQGKFVASLTKLDSQIVKAAKGEEKQVALFKKLGVEVRNADGSVRSADVVFRDLAETFQNTESGAAKTALVISVFGAKLGGKLIPLLNQGADGLDRFGAEAERTGRVIDEKTAKASNDFNDNLTRLKGTTKTFSLAVAKELSPALASVTDWFTKSAEGSRALETAASGIAIVFRVAATAVLPLLAFLRQMAEGVGSLIVALRDLGDGAKATWEAFALFRKGDFSGARIAVDAAKNSFNQALLEMDASRERQLAVWTDLKDTLAEMWGASSGLEGSLKRASDAAGDTGLDDIPPPVDKDYVESIKKAREQLQSLIADQREASALLGNESEGAAMKYRLTLGDLADSVKLLGAEGEVLADKLIEQAYAFDVAKAAAEGAAEGQRKHKEMMEEGAQVIEEVRTPLENYYHAVARLGHLLEAGAIDPDTFGKKLKLLDKELEDSTKRTSEFADAFTSQLGSLFEENLFNNFDEGLKGMYAGFVDILRKMIAQLIASNLMKLFGLNQGGRGWSGLADMGVSLGARADGGPVYAGQSYVVGERGPEPFIPTVSGHIMSNEEWMKQQRDAGPRELKLSLTDRALGMTMRDWLMGELANEAANR